MPKKKLKILFLYTRPNDLAYMDLNIFIEWKERGHSVTNKSMIKGIYGPLTPNLYGVKLAKIRERELVI